MKQRIIVIEPHALLRIEERGALFGLTPWETKRRVEETIRRGICSKRKHKSRKHETYYRYFEDGIAVYAICKENAQVDRITTWVKTIIVEAGRE